METAWEAPNGLVYVCSFVAAYEQYSCDVCEPGAHAHEHATIVPLAQCEGCLGEGEAYGSPCTECGGTGRTRRTFAGFLEAGGEVCPEAGYIPACEIWRQTHGV